MHFVLFCVHAVFRRRNMLIAVFRYDYFRILEVGTSMYNIYSEYGVVFIEPHYIFMYE